MGDRETRERPPLGYLVTMILIGLYLAFRLVEGAVCLADWLVGWGTCPWSVG